MIYELIWQLADRNRARLVMVIPNTSHVIDIIECPLDELSIADSVGVLFERGYRFQPHEDSGCMGVTEYIWLVLEDRSHKIHGI